VNCHKKYRKGVPVFEKGDKKVPAHFGI